MGCFLFYNLFYFFNFFLEPRSFSIGIYFLRYIIDCMACHVFNCVLIHFIFLCHCNEMLSSVMCLVVGIQFQNITNFIVPLLIFIVSQFISAIMGIPRTILTACGGLSL